MRKTQPQGLLAGLHGRLPARKRERPRLRYRNRHRRRGAVYSHVRHLLRGTRDLCRRSREAGQLNQKAPTEHCWSAVRHCARERECLTRSGFSLVICISFMTLGPNPSKSASASSLVDGRVRWTSLGQPRSLVTKATRFKMAPWFTGKVNTWRFGPISATGRQQFRR